MGDVHSDSSNFARSCTNVSVFIWHALVEWPCSPVPTATNVPNTTNVPTMQPSTSSPNDVAIAVGVVVGFVVLLPVVAIAVVIVILLVTKKGMQHLNNCQSL